MRVPPKPAFMTAEGNELIAAFERGYRRGLEDAAKIAEDAIDLGYRGGADKWAIADAIRARMEDAEAADEIERLRDALATLRQDGDMLK
jgi:hypothetical protein